MAEIHGNAVAGREGLSPVARNAIVGATIGWAVDFYDIYLPAGALTPALGRRPVTAAGGLIALSVGTLLYYLFITNILSGGSLILSLALAAAAFVVAGSAWGLPTTYITERFPTGIRASAYGVGYSLAVVIPSLFNFYLLGLARLMPYPYTVLVMVFLGGLLTAIGAWIGPETRDVVLKARALD